MLIWLAMQTATWTGLSLNALTDRLNGELKQRGQLPIKPRTLYSYVAKGLLKSAGRGPNARYPERSLYVLLFIKQLQDKVRLTLDEIGEILRRIPDEVIKAVATGKEPLNVVALRSSWSVEGSARGHRPIWGVAEQRAKDWWSDQPAPTEWLSAVTSLRNLATHPNDFAVPGRWTSVEVTPGFAIAVRSIDARALSELEALATQLRRLVKPGEEDQSDLRS
jgi:DNA-binding transcriptional MerR regulator